MCDHFQTFRRFEKKNCFGLVVVVVAHVLLLLQVGQGRRARGRFGVVWPGVEFLARQQMRYIFLPFIIRILKHYNKNWNIVMGFKTIFLSTLEFSSILVFTSTLRWCFNTISVYIIFLVLNSTLVNNSNIIA